MLLPVNYVMGLLNVIVLCVLMSGTPDGYSLQSVEVWTGVTYALSATMIAAVSTFFIFNLENFQFFFSIC